MDKDLQELKKNNSLDTKNDFLNQTFSNVKKAFVWLGFLAFFSVFNETVFNVTLPVIEKQFGVQPAAANWVNTSFILSFAIGTVIYGKISDVYGIRNLLVIGLLTYSGGSLFGILAHSYLPAIFAARFIQGAGASAVPALIMVMVARYVRSEDRGKAFGIIGSLVAMGEGIGPAIGGIIAHYVHWSLLFIIPMLTLVSMPFFLRELPNESISKSKIDTLGATLLSIGIVMFTLYTTQYNWIYIFISVFILAWFSVHIHRTKAPFIKPSVFRNKKFIIGVLTGCILLSTVAGFLSMIPYMMRDVYQLNTVMIGMGILFPGTISVIFFGIVGGILVDKRGNNFVLSIGLVLIIFSFLVISLLIDRAALLITVMLILILGGLSFVKTVISNCVAASLKPEETGTGMSMLNFACFLSEGIGIAFVGGMLTNRTLDFPLLPGGNASSLLYSNVLLVFTVMMIIGGTLYTLVFNRK
ncbi:MFS transporter [Bacillus atrophaeus]|uniref:MFS transporter n=1 Tax=Bacillus atrophaeus TaxID=1452 RepID=UPI0039904099